MNPQPAFRLLQSFIKKETARKPRRNGPKPETANGLTKKIVEHIRNRGHFATRLQSTGTYRDDLQKFVPSQQRRGLPDVMAVVEGHSAFIEIKVGRDKLSKDQINAIAELQQAGAAVLVCSDFQSFIDWFTAEFLTPPFA